MNWFKRKHINNINMRLTFKHDRIDIINDILIYIYSNSEEKQGIFVDVHPKTYVMGIAQEIHDSMMYNDLKFSMKSTAEYFPLGSRIEQYQELTIEGHKQDIENFCKKVFTFAETRIDNSVIEGKLNIFNFDIYWEYYESCDFRKRDSLHLVKNEFSNVANDLQQFISEDTKARYKELGIPHSRTYMFFGPPGTGKTSLIKVLASEINYNIGMINFSKDLDDKTLKRAISKRPRNSIIVLEDIDCLFDSRKQSDAYSTNITFSGLLNTLDGIVTHENFIVIITTNHLEVLDHALKRRVDYYVKFDYCTKSQVKSMYHRFFPNEVKYFEEFYNKIKHVKATPNNIQKFFTRYLNKNVSDYTDEFCKYINAENDQSNTNMYT